VARYNLLAIPVVDKETRLVGISPGTTWWTSSMMRATEDMLKMSGTQIEEEDVAHALLGVSSGSATVSPGS